MPRDARSIARRTAFAASIAVALPTLAGAQTPPPEQPVYAPVEPVAQPPGASPWSAQTPQPQPAAQPIQQPIQQPNPQPEPMYLDPYGRPIGPGGAPIVYGTSFGEPVQYRQPPPHAPVNLRGMIGAQVGVIGFQDSPYRTASHAWGYDAFSTALNVAIDGGFHLHKAFLLGARVAYTNAGGGYATFDGAQMSLTAFDFNVIGRVGWPVPLGHANWIFYPGFQLELGGLYASTSLRLMNAAALLPRVAGQVALIFADRNVGIGLRLGYQYAVWPNAAGSSADLSFGGFMAAIGLEVRL